MDKQKIAVLFGGCSPEYGISLQSAYGVISYMDRNKYEPVLLGITRDGEWRRFAGDPEKIINDTWNNEKDCVPAIISPDRKTRGAIIFDENKPRSVRFDAAMPVLHGANGEDGTVQGLLELAGIPVIGCGARASAIGMDKSKSHKIAASAGVRVPKSFTVKGGNDAWNLYERAGNIGYPLFVKPVSAGSSLGITKVTGKNDIHEAVALAFEYGDEVIIEENINGFEVGCAIFENGRLTIGEVDEIELQGEGFFDYDEKYYRETARIHVPARIPREKAEEIKMTAEVIYRALGCSGFARVDMFLTPEGGIVFNEVNTIPGFTPGSRFSNMLKEAGYTFEQVINSIIGGYHAAS